MPDDLTYRNLFDHLLREGNTYFFSQKPILLERGFDELLSLEKQSPKFGWDLTYILNIFVVERIEGSYIVSDIAGYNRRFGIDEFHDKAYSLLETNNFDLVPNILAEACVCQILDQIFFETKCRQLGNAYKSELREGFIREGKYNDLLNSYVVNGRLIERDPYQLLRILTKVHDGELEERLRGVFEESPSEYYCTPYWRLVTRFKKASNPTCQMCDQEDSYATHHQTYTIVGKEHEYLFSRGEELIAICNCCHAKIHNSYGHSIKGRESNFFDDKLNIMGVAKQILQNYCQAFEIAYWH
ncbi:MAG: hypothetical protein MK096_13855 [Oleiphilaceae bacterium]|nr:hypothetical protein [Oleiphilaceae bacterium]